METHDWILLRCTPCSAVMKLKRGLAAVYVECPECRKILSVPEGILDPAMKRTIFPASELPDGLASVQRETPPVTPLPRESPREPSGEMAGGMAGGTLGVSAYPEQAAATSEQIFYQAASAPEPKKAKALDLSAPDFAETLAELKRETEATARSDQNQQNQNQNGEGKQFRRSLKKRKNDAGQIGWDAADSGSSRRPDRLEKRFSRIAVILILALGAALAYLVFDKKERAVLPVESEQELEKESLEKNQEGLPAIAMDFTAEMIAEDSSVSVPVYAAAKEAVAGFTMAKDLTSMLAFVRHRERVEPLAREYYRRTPYRPFGMRSMAKRDRIVRNEKFLALSVEGDAYKNREIGVEVTSAGMKVDWESFVGYSEMGWTDLLVRIPIEPVKMRARVTRDNYFNYTFANPSKFACYRLSDRDAGVRIFGYVEKGSDTANALMQAFGPNDQMLLILSLRFPDPAPVNNQVWIDEIHEIGWIERKIPQETPSQ